jgi:hypothetical protein
VELLEMLAEQQDRLSPSEQENLAEIRRIIRRSARR